MKKLILSAASVLFSIALFAQTSGTAAPGPKSGGTMTNSAPTNLAVSDPGVPNKKTSTSNPAPPTTKPNDQKEKSNAEGEKKQQGKGHGKGHNKK